MMSLCVWVCLFVFSLVVEGSAGRQGVVPSPRNGTGREQYYGDLEFGLGERLP